MPELGLSSGKEQFILYECVAVTYHFTSLFSLASMCFFDPEITVICTPNSCWNKHLKKWANWFVNKRGE